MPGSPDHRTRRRKRTETLGELCETKWYTRKRLNVVAGFGHQTLAEVLASDLVKSKMIGNTRWFSGAGIIAWIESQAA
jgi:hypothetical protein